MILGIEIGGTKLKLGVCDRRGRVKALERRSVERGKGAAGILAQIEEIAPDLLCGVTNYLDVGAATNVPPLFYRVRLVP